MGEWKQGLDGTPWLIDLFLFPLYYKHLLLFYMFLETIHKFNAYFGFRTKTKEFQDEKENT